MSTAAEGDQSIATPHAILRFVLSEEQLSSARNAGVWTKTTINSFRKLLESRRDKAVNEELQNLYDILLVSVESEFEVVGEAVADLQIELSLNRILRPTTTPGGNLTFFKDTRRVLHLHGGPSPNLQRGHPVDILVQILHGNAGSTAEDGNVISHRIREFRAFLESLHPTPILSPIAQEQQLGMGSQANAQAPRGMNYQRPQAAMDTEVVQDTRTVPGENIGAGVFNDHLRPTNPYSAGQYQYALELRQRRLSGTQYGNHANENVSASQSETRDPDYRDARGRTPEGTTSSVPADSAPDVPDEEFYWYNSMTEMQRQNGIRSFQSEFSNNNKFARHMSAEDSTMSKPTVLQDVHLAFIRLCKRYRFTERAARELIPYMYTGPAARQYTKVKKRSPQATTEELMAEMEKMYINGVTQRQASEEIRKLRLSATASSRRTAADDLIERLSIFSISCPPEDQTDEAMTNTLVHCVQHVPWARPLRQALIAKTVSDFEDACNTLSALATDEDIVNDTSDTIGIHTATVPPMSQLPRNRPLYDNRRLGNLQKAVTEYAKHRSNPLGKDGKPMVCRSRGCNSTEHFQYSGKCPVEKARRQQGFSTVHMAQCIVNDVMNGMDVWDCIAEILFSRAHEENDPVSNFPDVCGLASITDRDEHETGVIPTASAGFVATGIDSLADIIDMHFSTPDCDEGVFDDISVGVGFVEATDSDMDPQNHEDPKYEAATEIMSGQLEIAINVSPEEVFRFGRS
jgi:hypothetical protein